MNHLMCFEIKGEERPMIRFADKEEYIVHLGEMSRSQMLLFFLRAGGET